MDDVFFYRKIQSGGLSKQATASNILLQDFVYTREVVDKLSACFGAANIIDLNKWQTKIENEIASLNRRVHKHEKKGVEEEGRAEVGRTQLVFYLYKSFLANKRFYIHSGGGPIL